jgi:NADPH:quinone reductase-like Zn-dependent oxidoreductase
VTYDTATNTVFLTATAITLPGLTISDVRYAVIYHDTGNPATSVLIQYHDLGAATYATAQDVVLTPATSSIGTFAVA